MLIDSFPLSAHLNYEHFILELTRLTRRYGVAIKSVGGVHVAIDPRECCDVTYIGDIASGDLLPWGLEALDGDGAEWRVNGNS